MNRTERYRQQHVEIASLVTQLERELNARLLAQDASSARRTLATLAGKLTLHLAAEDQHLYPDLARNGNENVKRVATKFAHDMAPLAQVFVAYVGRWPSPSAIKADPNAFIHETNKVMSALKDRIRKENQEFYPLVDAA